MPGEEILADIDSTLDRLIENANAVNKISYKQLTDQEKEAFEKTQESLLAHLIHADEMFEKKQKELRIPNKKSAKYKLQEKLLHFEKIQHNKEFSKLIGLHPIKRKKPKIKKKLVLAKKLIRS